MTIPADWVERLKNEPLPVRRTVHARLSQIVQRDELAVTEVVGWVRRDPAVCAYILGTATRLQRERQRDAPHNIEHAIALLGHSWAATNLPQLPILDEVIPESDPRFGGYMTALSRAIYAAKQAERWAVELRDTSFENVVVAALLHNYIELALWRDAPELMRRALKRTRGESPVTLGKAVHLELEASAIDLDELEHAISTHFYLPINLYADESAVPSLAHHHQSMVLLARRLAFLSEAGWYHPGMQATLQQLAALLNRPVGSIERMVHETALKVARDLHPIGMYVSAGLMLAASDEMWPFPDQYAIDRTPGWHPQADNDPCMLVGYFSRRLGDQTRSLAQVFRALIETLSLDFGMDRIALYLRADDLRGLNLKTRIGHQGDHDEPGVIRFDDNPLIERLFNRPQALKIATGYRASFAPYISPGLHACLAGDALVYTFVSNGQPLAMILAQKSAASVDDARFGEFSRLGQYISRLIDQRSRG